MKLRKVSKRLLAAAMSGILLLATGAPSVQAQEAASEALEYVTAEGELKAAQADLIITSVSDMKKFAANPDAYSIVKLGCDIAFDGVTVNNFDGISGATGFRGTFDGCGYTISGIDITTTSGNAGLFRNINGATIKNVTVKNSSFSGGCAGAIVAYGSGTIINCRTEATVEVAGSDSAGGIAGNFRGEIRNCFSAGSVTLSSKTYGGAGGIVGGSGYASVYNSANTGKVSVVETSSSGLGYGGGIAGFAYNIQNCYNAGEVVTDDRNSTQAGEIASKVEGIAANNFYSSDADRVPYYSVKTDKNTTALPLSGMRTADFVSRLNTNRGDNTEWIAWELRESSAYPQHVPLIRITGAQITLSASSFTYDGTEKTPVVTVTYNGSTLVREQDYTLLYENATEVGTASVTIEGAGRYVDRVTRTYTIEPAPPAKGTVLSKGKLSYKVTKAGKEVSCTGFTTTASKVTIPATITVDGFTYQVTSVAANAFKGCTKLKSVTIGANVTTIGKKAFYNCTALTSIKIPNSVTSIGESAFSGCKKLKTATIGTGLKTIGKKAFYGCSVLKTINIKSSNLTKVGANAFKGIKATAQIKVPSKKFSSYKKLLKGKGQGSKVKIVKGS